MISKLSTIRDIGCRRSFQVTRTKITSGMVWELTDTLDREELELRCKQEGDFYCYENSETIHISPPKKFTHIPESILEFTGTYTTCKPFVCKIGPVELLGKQPIAITNDQQLILETAEGDREVAKDRVSDFIRDYGLTSLIRSLYLSNTNSKPDFHQVFPLVRYSDETTTYYHWLLGYAGKIRGLEKYRELTGQDPTILVEKDSPSWVDESLELLGINVDDCVRWDGSPANAESIVIPSHNVRRSANFNPSISECQWIRNRAYNTLNIENPTTNNRIFISRRDATDRHVANEYEIMRILRKFGFRSYVLSNLSIKKQVKLFSNAEIIIGPHGAGFTNMIFSTDPLVLELIPEDYKKPFFFCLARQLGFQYDCLICDRVGDSIYVNDVEMRTLLSQYLDEL